MGFNPDFMNNLNNRANQQVEIQEFRQKEKNRMEIPYGDDPDENTDFSYKAQKRMRRWRILSGIFLIGAMLYGIYWYLHELLF